MKLPFAFPTTLSSTGWMALGFDAWSLGLEASSVIGLRTLKLAAGGTAAQAEAEQMISEKVDSLFTLQTMALNNLGASPVGTTHKAVTHYRRKVRANNRRLMKP